MVKVKIYTLAAVITFLLIASSLAFNWYLNLVREGELNQELLDLQTSISESQLELTYLLEFSGGCDLLKESTKSTRNGLFTVNKKLLRYKEYLIGDVIFNRLKTEQTILYIKLWLVTQKVRETCQQNISTVLYFFDVYTTESQQQGFVLDTITEEYGDTILVIPLDFNFDIGMIKILSKQFDITETPSIVINEKIILEGLHSKDEILNRINTNS